MDGTAERDDVGDAAAYASYKRELIGSLRGSVLEVGAGRGANFAAMRHVTHWIGVEPSHRRRTALRRASVLPRAEVLAGTAERLPVANDSVDNVLATVVLCSVRDQSVALSEIERVLRPGGRFVFAEHVAAPPGTGSCRAQRLWAPLSRTFDHGCDPTRRTWEPLEHCGLVELRIRWFELPMTFGLRSPYIVGQAVRPAAGTH